MADIDFAAVAADFEDALIKSAEPHLGTARQWAAEDREFFRDQAKVSSKLLQDMAHAVSIGDEDMQAMIRDAIEQHASTISMRITGRRWQAAEVAQKAAADAVEAAVTVALRIGVRLLTAGIAG